MSEYATLMLFYQQSKAILSCPIKLCCTLKQDCDVFSSFLLLHARLHICLPRTCHANASDRYLRSLSYRNYSLVRSCQLALVLQTDLWYPIRFLSYRLQRSEISPPTLHFNWSRAHVCSMGFLVRQF